MAKPGPADRHHCRRLSRRDLLGYALGLAGLAAVPARLRAVVDAPSFATDPFTLGVASGFPAADGMVLWTRLAPSPQVPGGGMPDAVVPVVWEIASDEGMRRTVQKGTAYATPDWGHSVHVEPIGLEPQREYWYRFTAGGFRSPVGRTTTAPAAGAAMDHLRIAMASCQQYEHGYYVAYRHIVRDEPDLIVHLGDYIYEMGWGGEPVRRHDAPEPYTLDDYRARHALYRGDPELRAAHAACPWLLTWDDHEVDNDYADRVSEENDVPELFLARRAAAYRAYYEHMPLPRRALPFGPHLRLYSERSFGGLARILMLDERQYRSPTACPRPERRGANRVSDCAELADPRRSKLGIAQEQWLTAQLAASQARWNLIGVSTVMAYIDEQAGPGEMFWTDNWNGYPAARERLLQALHGTRTRNPVLLSGDIHAFVVSNINRVPADRGSPVVASEFTTTSITSLGMPQSRFDALRAENPNLLLASSEHHGYLRLDLTAERLEARLMAMETVKRRESAGRVLASFVVEDGRAGPVKS